MVKIKNIEWKKILYFTIGCISIFLCSFLFAGCNENNNSKYLLCLTADFQDTYYLNEEIDYENFYVVVKEKENNRQNSKIINLYNENIELFDFNTSSIGTRSATIKYSTNLGSVSIGFEYSVIERPTVVEEIIELSEINNVSIMNFQRYVVDDDINLKNAVLFYTDNYGNIGSTRITKEMISGFDTSTTGDKIMTISFGGKSIERWYRVYEKVDEILSFEFPKKLYCGERRGPDKHIITYRNVNGEIKEFEYDNLEMCSFVNCDTNKLGEKEVLLKFRHKTFKFNVEVKDVVISGIRLDNLFTCGQELDLSEAYLVYNKNDNIKVNLTTEMITGFDTTTTGKKVMIISYRDDSIDFEYEVK